MNRRESAEENYRQKFNNLGLTGHFEFLEREWSAKHDKRFWCRCKTCGEVFLSYNDVFRGRQKHLLCPKCGSASDGADMLSRSPVVDDAMAYYTEGHSVIETAEKYMMTPAQVNNFVKARKLSNGRSWRTAANKNRIEKSSLIVQDYLSMRNLELLEPWEGKEKLYTVRDKATGEAFQRKGRSLLPKLSKNSLYRSRRRNAYVDGGITIDGLMKRDGSRCYICGKETDFKDRRWGNFGPNYPTIDHVIPLAGGGKHSWNNVRVCCAMCNILKSDKGVDR